MKMTEYHERNYYLIIFIRPATESDSYCGHRGIHSGSLS